VIAEAIDTAITLGWALAAWIAVLAAVASIVLLAGTAVGMWAVRGAWRVLCGHVAASRAPQAPFIQPAPERAPQRRSKHHPSPAAPTWAQPDKEPA
jgi:hypothetical protein